MHLRKVYHINKNSFEMSCWATLISDSILYYKK